MRVKKWTNKKILEGGEPFFLKGTKKDEAVLLFHGWSSTPQEIKSTAYHLNSLGYSVYAPLLIGHGTEPKDLTGLIWEDWLRHAQSFYDDLARDYKKIFVGGMSMGANISLNIAAHNKVSGVIAMGTPLFFQFEPVLRVWSWMFRNTTSIRKKHYTPRDTKIAKKKVHYLYFPPQSMYEAVRSGLTTRGMVSKITAPIFIIHTNTDHVTSIKSVDFLMSQVKSEIKEKLIVKNCYHVFTVDKCADRVNKAIGEFVEKTFNSE